MNLKQLVIVALLLLAAPLSVHARPLCGKTGVWLQVLGSGGPELNDKRASSGYLVWQDGRARVLVDMGPGSMLRYEESGARIEDLEVILLTHLHVDHSADLPALLKASYFSERTSNLPVYGPTGNALMPDTVVFVHSLFEKPNGAYRYLAGYLSGDEAFRLQPHSIPADGSDIKQVTTGRNLNITAVAVHHGPIPALAWRVDIGDRAIAFSGDMNGDNHTLPNLALDANMLVAHHAIPQNASGVARSLHMPPSVIGEIAAEAKIRKLILSHRMKRTLGKEMESKAEIRKRYTGFMRFADDGQCFKVN